MQLFLVCGFDSRSPLVRVLLAVYPCTHNDHRRKAMHTHQKLQRKGVKGDETEREKDRETDRDEQRLKNGNIKQAGGALQTYSKLRTRSRSPKWTWAYNYVMNKSTVLRMQFECQQLKYCFPLLIHCDLVSRSRSRSLKRASAYMPRISLPSCQSLNAIA